MTLSIIILNYKTKNMTKQCLKNIVNLNLSLKYEIIVVDNDSQDGIEQMMREDFPIFKFIQTGKNRGMGAGNNVGIRAARGEYILILNPDVVVLKNAIESLVEFMQNNEKIGCVAPKILSPDRSVQDTVCRWPKLHTFLYRRTVLGKTRFGKKHLEHFLCKDKVILDKAMKTDWFFGCCFLVRKDVLDQVGLYDERFFLFLEETDLCRRMWQDGWEVWYLPEAHMIHYPHRRTTGTGTLADLFSKYTWIHLYSWIKYFFKWR